MSGKIGVIPDSRYLKRGFSALQMLYWCSAGSSTTYIVSYMTAVRGASASLTGLLIALYMLCGCAGQFVINAICDRFQNNRKVFTAGMVLSLLVWYGVYFAPNMPMLFVMYGLVGFIHPTMAAILDTWLIRSFPNDSGAYSPIRSMGSLAYSGLMLVMGFAIDGVGHSVMVVLPTLFTIGSVVMAHFMPEIPAIERPLSGEERKNVGLSAIQPVVWMFIAANLAMGIANMPLLNMNLLIMENAGGTVANQGIAISCNTIAEFITMQFIMRALSRVSARRKLLLAGMLYIVSTTMILTLFNIYALYVAFFINGIAYGVILPSRRQFVNETAPGPLLNRMHGLSDIAYISAGGLIGNQCSGIVIDKWGVSVMVAISLTLEAVSFALMTTFKRLQKKKTSQSGIDSAA